MSESENGIDGRSNGDCSTTGSFNDHGIEDGSDLVSATHYRLRDAGIDSFEATASFFDALESAFRWAYLGAVDEPGVPPHVDYAIADARAFVEAEFDDREDADLRQDVVQTFYREVAGFHCAHRD